MSQSPIPPHAASPTPTGHARTMKIVYSISERQPGKSFWTRIGVGFVNQDGSLNLRLDCVPIGGGTIQVRDYDPRDADRDDGPQRWRPRRDESTADHASL